MSDDLSVRVGKAVKHFWTTREYQLKKQKGGGRLDKGARGAVTGGAQLDGFVRLTAELLEESGLHNSTIFRKSLISLPGYFRPTKEWDLLVVNDGILVASIEFKSQVGPSFGNNFNNRAEEAIGSATDLWAAYREGVFSPSPRPWLGYFMLLEETEKSVSPVSVDEPHFKVLPEYVESSYAKRYEILCMKLVRERLYDAACFLMSDRRTGKQGRFKQPSEELGIANFFTSLCARAAEFSKRHF
jgi:hypothetical protein